MSDIFEKFNMNGQVALVTGARWRRPARRWWLPI